MAASGNGKPTVLIAGGGIAGLEAAMALADIAGPLAALTVIAPEEEFELKALAVREPFTKQPSRRDDLRSVLEKLGAEHVIGAISVVAPDHHEVELTDGSRRRYGKLVVCLGGRPKPVLSSAETFWWRSGRLAPDELISKASASPSRALAVVIPPGASWPLPAYELALLLRRRSNAIGCRDLVVRVVTAEPSPLSIFGREASAAVAKLLSGRGVEVVTASEITEEAGKLRQTPADVPLEAGAVIALPRIDGPRLEGLPSDQHGFIIVDEHCRVIGVEDAYAAGDGTSFPVKQGGLATQQADAAAEHVAASLGASLQPSPFRPVLRGELLTGEDSLKLRRELEGDGGDGEASSDYLWWPRQKVAGRYLSAWLAGIPPGEDMEPRVLPLEVEAAWPHGWHGEPMLGRVSPF